MAALIRDGRHEELIQYGELGRSAHLAVPTNEHYLPLLYVLGAGGPEDDVSFYNGRVTLRSVSMTSVRIGQESSI